jgi:SAM-dependent methyltransferase
MLPISGFSRLSFVSHFDYRVFAERNAKLLTQIWLWHETLGNRPEPFSLNGICDVCECQTAFAAKPKKLAVETRFQYAVDWWGGTTCTCNLSNLDRAVLRVFFEAHDTGDRVYHVGHHSRFRQWLDERIPNLTSSQYEPGRQPGEVEAGIRYEDLTRLSFGDSQFSCIISMEILEHIPDYIGALREMARVLVPGGRALLTFPWLGRDTYEHVVRAEMMADGSVQHFLPPEFHGDPANPDGILSFRSFGWRILDEVRASGFSKSSAEFVFSPMNGYMLLNPVIVGVK